MEERVLDVVLAHAAAPTSEVIFESPTPVST